MEGGGADTGKSGSSELHETRVNAGYKATLKSTSLELSALYPRVDRPLADPNVSEEAKEHAREVLGERGVDEEPQQTTGSTNPEDLHETRVNAGYKATLKSTRLLSAASDSN
jgi:hypothetical protein